MINREEVEKIIWDVYTMKEWKIEDFFDFTTELKNRLKDTLSVDPLFHSIECDKDKREVTVHILKSRIPDYIKITNVNLEQ